MAFDSLQEIIDTGAKKAKPFWRVVMEEDVQERGVTEESSLAMMENMWNAMFSAVRDYEGNLHSRSGLVGGMGQTMDEYLEKGDTYCGDFVSKVIATALKTGESNACMKRIVAAPTAGACGVLPAVIVPYFEEGKADKDKIIEALYVAAGIGQVIAARAYIAGATGGCQAEIGSASAMAAGALVIPWLSDRMWSQNRLPWVIISSVGSVITVLGFMNAKPGLLSSMLLFFAGFFIYGINSLVWAFATDIGGRIFGGTATGILDCAAYIGASVQAIYFGNVLTNSGNWTLVFACIVGVLVVMIIAALLAGKGTKVKSE